jgi:hypothetical protein
MYKGKQALRLPFIVSRSSSVLGCITSSRDISANHRQ